jgi:hypothetical protein
MSEGEALDATQHVYDQISSWLTTHKDTLSEQEHTYIRNHVEVSRANPFGQFYILYKIHKGLKHGRWPTRPVCSDVSSIPHSLGKWITEQLLPVAQAQPSYFRDSFALKELLLTLGHLPDNAEVFTSDATSMYTNIPTNPALSEISRFLRNLHQSGRFRHYDPTALIEALHLVFTNNIFKFGDTFWRQTSGTGMGISPAPPWATIFYAIHENGFLPRWSRYVLFYKRFIDDVFGIWLRDPCPRTNASMWQAFQQDMNDWHGLEWICTPPSSSCNFMDMVISIENHELVTRVYEKDMNLYLYLPPHSAHSAGTGTGLVFGQVLRYRRLSTYQSDADTKIRAFMQRLLARGHSRDSLLHLFTRAEENAAKYMARSQEEHIALQREKQESSKHKIFLHLQYHTEDPPARDIQRLWREYVALPKGERPLPEMKNLDGYITGIDSLVIAYSRPVNLRNLFSVRDIHDRGQKVSSYLAK